jgi:hypothetical protein
VNVQPVSIIGFREATEDGTIASRCQILARAYARLAPPDKGTPRTTQEVCKLAELGLNQNLWNARGRDLRRDGVIKVVGHRRCTITGFLADVCEYVMPENRVPVRFGDLKKTAILELCDTVQMFLDDPKKSLELSVEQELRDRLTYFRNLYGDKPKKSKKPRKSL